MATTEFKPLIEALIFASDAPLRLERIAEVLEVTPEQAADALRALAADYDDTGRGLMLAEVAGGFQLRSRPEFGEWIRRLGRSRPVRFSRAAMETLAIVAYRQPVTRAEIEYLRGVDSGGVLKTLLDRHLIRIMGKKDLPGRPVIYGTTREFLELFGLADLTGLPTLREFSEISPELLPDFPDGAVPPDADPPAGA